MNARPPSPLAPATTAGEGPDAPLGRLFAPRSVALVGASDTPGSVGRALAGNLVGFGGDIHFVNPRHPTILGRPCHRDLASIPTPVDLAVIATPAPGVPGLLEQCGALGIPAAIIISAGFRECPPAGVILEAQAVAAARRHGIRLLGPNCLGAMVPRRRLNATFADGMAQAGRLAFLSQSGALCTAVLDWSRRENIGFSAFVSVGSMADVDWGDLIRHFGEDPDTEALACYIESVGDAHRFLAAAVARRKPILVLKVGHTDAGARAAASHTGSLTGSDAALDAAFRRVGVLRVDTIEELFDLAELLSKHPRPSGPRLAIVTNAGGPGALAADSLVRNQGEIAPLADATRARLDGFLPAHWSHGNPIDILGDADVDRYARAVACAVEDPTSDGVLVILTPQAMTRPTETAMALRSLASRTEKPLLASWMGGDAVAEARACLNACGIPTFDHPDTAARMFAWMHRHSEHLRRLELEAVAPCKEPSTAAQGLQAAAEARLQVLRRSGRTLLDAAEAHALLQAHGLPIVPTQVAHSAAEAVQVAQALGYPVAVKLLSATLSHKTDVDGVHLDLADAPAVHRAWDAIRDAVAAHVGPQHFQGVIVQPMIRHAGQELILGSSCDPQLGPVLLFGAGGVLAEVYQDTALDLPPLDRSQARRLMARTRIHAALRGIRGRPPVDLPALEGLVASFSRLVVSHPAIAEIDLNPVVAAPGTLWILDARVVLHPLSIRDADLPRPALVASANP